MVLQSTQPVSHFMVIADDRCQIVAVLASKLGQQPPTFPHGIQTCGILLEALSDNS